jgi:hypothetical protein
MDLIGDTIPAGWRCVHPGCRQQAVHRDDPAGRARWCHRHRTPDATALDGLVHGYPIPTDPEVETSP